MVVKPVQIDLPGFKKRTKFHSPVIPDFVRFRSSFVKYFSIKAQKTLLLPIKTATIALKASENAKFYVTRKLIWGRGRLSRPISHVTIIGLTSWVFLTGGILSGTPVVRSAMDNGDILSSNDMVVQPNYKTDIVPSVSASSDPIKYVVKDGDTLSSIGSAFGVSLDTIRYANNISETDVLTVGKELTILPVDGIKVKVEEGNSVEGLAKKYAASAQAIVDFNYLDEPYTLKEGQEVIIPGGKMPAPVPVVTPEPDNGYSIPYAYGYQAQTQPNPAGTGQFRWPTDTYTVTQYFSYYHPAIDIAPYSTLYAADAGTVVRAGWWPNGYGNAVQIDHGNGYTTTYAHMSQIDVSVGQQMQKGQQIGLMGNTGRSFGTHVHFVIQYFGQYVNPLSFF